MEPKANKIIVAANLNNPKWHRLMNVVLSPEGICTTINTCGGENLEPKILIGAMCGRNPENPSDRTAGSPTEQRLEIKEDGITNTLTTVQKDNLVIKGKRVRRLIPKECWRLMGFDDEDFDKAKAAGVSNSQLYKQAGNSIVVNVLEAIFGQMMPEEKKNETNHQ